MTDEEKAEILKSTEKLWNERNRLAELEEENAELKERLKGFESGEVAWQGDMDRTIEQNLHLKKEIEALKARMDRMKKSLPVYMLRKYIEEDK